MLNAIFEGQSINDQIPDALNSIPMLQIEKGEVLYHGINFFLKKKNLDQYIGIEWASSCIRLGQV